MNFSTELEKLRKIKKQCLLEANSLEAEEIDELAKAKERIQKIYEKLKDYKYQELRKNNDKINSYCQKIEVYSIFNANEIGNIIANLMITFEGENYVYQDTYYELEKEKTHTLRTEVNRIKSHIKIIVKQGNKSDLYTAHDINSLLKNKKIIILNSTDTQEDEIQFYRANTGNHSIEQCVRFGRFNYVKEFIDELISYKIENKLKSISYEEVEDIKVDFIASRINQIEENYRLLNKQKEEQIAQERQNRELQLRKTLNRQNN